MTKNTNTWLIIAYTDIETGGIDEDQDDIVEIGIHRVEYPEGYFQKNYSGPEPVERNLSIKMNPTRPLDPAAAEVNGYTPERWKYATDLPTGLTEAYALFKGARFASWNPFDQNFLMRKFKQLGWRWPKGMGYRMIDVQTTCFPFTAVHFPDPIAVNQEQIAKKMGILGEDEKQKHEGLADAKLNRLMFDYMMRQYFENFDVTPCCQRTTNCDERLFKLLLPFLVHKPRS